MLGMRAIVVSSFICMLTWIDAHADGIKDAMKEFGLAGTFSPDCSKRPEDGIRRTTWNIPMFGPPTVTMSQKWPKLGLDSTIKYLIKGAKMVSDDKISVTSVLVESIQAGEHVPVDEKLIENVIYQKVGAKYRLWSYKNERTNVENGRHVQLGVETSFEEKCRD